MAIKSLAQTLKDLAAGIKNTITGITSSNATLTIIKGNGTTSTVTVNNVANAGAATKATQDSAGQQINSTYIKGLSVSGQTITYTKGNNTTGTITTQDTAYTHPNSGVTAGTYKSVTVNAQGHVTAGSNPTTLAGYGITDASLKGHTHNDIYYTESEIDSKVNTINSSLNNKSDTSHTHDDRYYTESEMNTKLSGKSDTTHTHDDIYYTESEIDSKVNTINSSINNKADKTHTHSQYLTASSELNVGKLKGVISLDNLPAGALERLVKVTNDTARFSLTTNDIQLGDTVKVESTKMMYIVKDITKLNSEDGYEQYTASMASSVPWSGVTGKPSSYTPSAHTHDDRYYTESEINSKVNTINSSIDTKADKTHTHDDRYYTESEIDSKLSTKSPLIGSTSLSKLSSNVTFGDGGAFSITQNDGSWWQRLRTVDNNDKTQKRLIYEESQGNSGSSYTELFSVDGNGNIYAGGTLLSKNGHTHDDRYYTESEMNTKLAGKSDTTHTHDNRYYTESEIDSKVNTINTSINNKSDKTHTHDDRYYTESEINTKLSGKSDTSHTHNYLPLVGGTTTGKVNMKSANLDNLPQIFRTDGVNFAGIRFQNTNGYLGAIGITGNVNNVVQRLGSDGNLYPILDSSNYNSYAPTKTGGGASGTWDISISGKANTAGTADTSKSCSGNSATATKATQDSSGQQINTTYIKGLSVSGKTITYTKGNGSTGTITTQDTVYTHPTTAGNKHIPSGGSSGQILRWSADGTAVWGADNNTTYSPATQSANGLMSAADKKKLDCIATGANAYTHPNSGVTAGTYKSVTVNAQGHVTGGSNPTTIAGYGITDAPTKTGGGASGTWGINISGNSATATNAANANRLSSESGRNYLSIDTTKDSWDVLGSNPGNWLKSIRTNANAPVYSLGNYSAAIAFGGADTKGIITHAYGDPIVKFAGGAGSTARWKFVIKGGSNNETYDLNNFPTKTGGGASGTWGINISGKANMAGTADTSKACSGNSASATKLATARNFKVNLASTGAASFNGTADATPGVTGTLPIANGGTGATTAAAARSNLGITCANIGAASASHTHGYVPLAGGTITGTLVINSPNVNNFNEGIRLTRAYNGWVGITFGSTGDAGRPEGGWFAATNPQGQFIISPDDSGNTNGLTLNKNGALLWRNTQISLNGHTHDYIPLAGGTITGQISKQNISTSWVSGRNIAPFRTIAASSPGDEQYVPVLSAKTYQGSWDIGSYTSNILHFSYITDVNFNAGNNTQTADIQFQTNGTVVAKNFSGAFNGINIKKDSNGNIVFS